MKAEVSTQAARAITSRSTRVDLLFSGYFRVDPALLDRYGAFDISLNIDLPLFFDPFLLFNSKKKSYQRLHESIIAYRQYLRDRSTESSLDEGTIQALYRFPEVEEVWLGFSENGNHGNGLGRKFALALNRNLNLIFKDFGNEQITQGSHLEKLCLIGSGVGRDHVSDFTVNLIKGYLLRYTQIFAQKHIDPSLRRRVAVRRTQFNYSTHSWVSGEYDLPFFRNEYILLSPNDMLTKDETWINRPACLDLCSTYQMRCQIVSYAPH
jgi:hypothetical protein